MPLGRAMRRERRDAKYGVRYGDVVTSGNAQQKVERDRQHVEPVSHSDGYEAPCMREVVGMLFGHVD